MIIMQIIGAIGLVVSVYVLGLIFKWEVESRKPQPKPTPPKTDKKIINFTDYA
jgi:hypothetical protein